VAARTPPPGKIAAKNIPSAFGILSDNFSGRFSSSHPVHLFLNLQKK